MLQLVKFLPHTLEDLGFISSAPTLMKRNKKTLVQRHVPVIPAVGDRQAVPRVPLATQPGQLVGSRSNESLEVGERQKPSTLTTGFPHPRGRHARTHMYSHVLFPTKITKLT